MLASPHDVLTTPLLMSIILTSTLLLFNSLYGNSFGHILVFVPNSLNITSKLFIHTIFLVLKYSSSLLKSLAILLSFNHIITCTDTNISIMDNAIIMYNWGVKVTPLK